MNYEYELISQEELMNPMEMKLPNEVVPEETLPELIEEEIVPENDPYAGYSSHALLLAHYKEQGLINGEINPDATAEDVADALQSYYQNKMKQEFEPQATEEDLEIVRYLKQGGRPEPIQETYSVQKLANPNRDVLEERKASIIAYLNQTIHIDKYRKSAIEDAELDDFQDEALLKQASDHFNIIATKQREAYIANQNQEAKAKEQQKLQFIQDNTQLINGGKVKDIEIPKENRAAFIKALFEETEKVTVPTPDGPREIKVPKAQLRWNEVMSNPEEYLALMYGILFGYNGIKKDIINNHKRSALDSLNTAVSSKPTSKLIGNY